MLYCKPYIVIGKILIVLHILFIVLQYVFYYFFSVGLINPLSTHLFPRKQHDPKPCKGLTEAVS